MPNAEALDRAFTAPSVLEKAVKIKHEIAIVVARSASGKMEAFPPVEMIFDEELNLIDYLYCPTSLDELLIQAATNLAYDVTDKIGIIGLLAIELFIDEEDNILVNELAPRTHNSGHHTIEANNVSQFEQHIRAVADLPLQETKMLSTALMMNLVGADGHSGPAVLEGKSKLSGLENVYLHWYGKSETRPGRKMGHVTILGRSKTESIALAEEIRSWLKVISK